MGLKLLSRVILAALASFSAALTASAQTTTPPAWASARAGGTGSQSVGATAVDVAGNTYETGTFTTSTTVGGVSLTSQGNNDAYLAKYTPSGTLLWVRQLGSTGYDLGLDVAVDAAGNAYVVGSFSATIALGNGSTLQLEGGTNSNSKGFIVRYSPQGTPDWAQQSSVNAASSVTMSGVAIDALGNVCVGGYMSRSITIGTTTAATSGNVFGDFIGRFALASGALQQLITGFEYAPATATITPYYYPRLVAAPGGQLYLLNQFSQSIILNNNTFTSRGLVDGLVVRFGTQNTPEWAQQFGGSADDRITNGAVDAAGNLLVTGSFTGPATFGSSIQPGFGSPDGYLVKYSPQGTLLWVQPMGGSGADNFSDLTLDAAGNVYVSGSFTATAQCGPATLASAGINDVVVASYNPQGQLRWVQQAGGPGSDVGGYIGLDARENIYVLGRFATGCSFGPQVLTTAATYESFVARLGSAGLASRAGTIPPLLACYPNPATTQVYVPGLPASATVQLFDAQGHLARKVSLASDATLSVLGLAPGFYILRTTTSLGQPITGKLTVE